MQRPRKWDRLTSRYLESLRGGSLPVSAPGGAFHAPHGTYPIPPQPPVFGKLRGSASPYDYAIAWPKLSESGDWEWAETTDYFEARAIELNDKAGLDGKVVELLGNIGGWRPFQCNCLAGPPPVRRVVCVTGCGGAYVPDARVVVVDGDGDTFLDAMTGPGGCTIAASFPDGSYHATVTPPAGIPGWEATELDFTIPGGLTSPIPLTLSDGYTCGCRAPGRHDYFGSGNPKANLPDTLYFSCNIGACSILWFPPTTPSMHSGGIYYGYFMVASFPQARFDPYTCPPIDDRPALVEVWFNPCGGTFLPFFDGRNTGWSAPCTSGGQGTFWPRNAVFSAQGLVFGVRHACGCVWCGGPDAYSTVYDRIPNPNISPMSNPHSAADYNAITTADGPAGGASLFSGVFSGGYTLSNSPYLWTANHFRAAYGNPIYACVEHEFMPAGTVVISA